MQDCPECGGTLKHIGAGTYECQGCLCRGWFAWKQGRPIFHLKREPKTITFISSNPES